MAQQDIQEIFTKRFRELRKEDETQLEFADRLNISRPTVAQYYNGMRVPDSRMLQQICQKCNVSADWLLGLSNVSATSADIQITCKTLCITETMANNIIDLNKHFAIDSADSNPLQLLFEEDYLWYAFSYLMQYKSIRPFVKYETSRYDAIPSPDGQYQLDPFLAADYFIKMFCSRIQRMLEDDLQQAILENHLNQDIVESQGKEKEDE